MVNIFWVNYNLKIPFLIKLGKGGLRRSWRTGWVRFPTPNPSPFLRDGTGRGSKLFRFNLQQNGVGPRIYLSKASLKNDRVIHQHG